MKFGLKSFALRICLILFFLFSSLATYADPDGDGLCDSGNNLSGESTSSDIDDVPCPLDSYVIVLFACSLVVTSYYLYRKNKPKNQTL
jgi:hypothetical protein